MSSLRIVLNLEAAGWLGGRYYLQNLALALATLPERPEVLALDRRGRAEGFEGVAETVSDIPADADAVFPNWALERTVSVPQIHWIPDLQHRALPQNFSRADRLRRDLGYRRLTRRARAVVASSHVVARDIECSYRSARGKVRVVHFRTAIPQSVVMEDPAVVPRRYDLPSRYALLANQFWKHKDHATAFAAAARISIPLVCTGTIEDTRDPSYASRLAKMIEDERGSADIRTLGVVPRSDYLQLVRGAAVVIQPSLFEGWSSIVEDARAFGRPVVLSDIEVHREQAGDDAVLFAAQDPTALAAAVAAALELENGSEKDSLGQQADRVQAFGKRFLEVVSNVIGYRPVTSFRR